MIAAAPWLLVFVACKGDDGYERFNGDDSVEVGLTAGEVVEDPVTVELTSTTGSVGLGTGSVSPSSGPVDTVHTVTIDLLDEYEEAVTRVVVVTDAGDRGVSSHPMLQDSADHGRWWIELSSLGEPGETRTDVFTFELYSGDGDSDNGWFP